MYQDMFWEVKMVSMILTTSPIKFWLVYKNIELVSYAKYTWSNWKGSFTFPFYFTYANKILLH